MTTLASPRRRPTLAVRLARRGGRGARLAFALAMVAQLLAVVVVPVFHASLTRPLGAHVEQPGAPHHTHDEASCATCDVQHLVGRIQRAATVPLPAWTPDPVAVARGNAVVPAVVAFIKSPRAPPVLV